MRAALYIDIDNMLGYCYSLSYSFSPKSVIDFIGVSGHDVVQARSYGSIPSALSHLDDFMKEEDILSVLKRTGIHHTSCSGKKNTADLTLSLEAMSNSQKYDIMYIVSSDADFIPLAHQLEKIGKKVVSIRMFQPLKPKLEVNSTTDIYYPALIGKTVEPGLDVQVLIYRDIVESVLKMPLMNPNALTTIMELTLRNFIPGMSIGALAGTVGKKGTYKVLKTAFFGKGFVADKYDRKILLSTCGGVKELRSAYYRQCEFILKKAIRGKLSAKALNKMFMLEGEKFSLETRAIETI